MDLTATPLSEAWRATWPSAPRLRRVEGDGGSAGTIAAEAAGLTGAVGMMPVPIPGGELEGPAATAWLWPDATSAIERVQAHAIVFVGGTRHPSRGPLDLTRLVAAVVQATGALGVYWGAASMVIQGDLFVELARSYDPAGLAVMLWVDQRVTVDDGGTSLFNVGPAKFGLMEIEVARSGRPPGEVRELVTNIATYLIENGPVIRDGDTVGGDEHERILARHAPSMIGRPGPVLRLEGS